METAKIYCNGKTFTVAKIDLAAYITCHELDPESSSEPFPFYVKREGVWGNSPELLRPDEIDVPTAEALNSGSSATAQRRVRHQQYAKETHD